MRSREVPRDLDEPRMPARQIDMHRLQEAVRLHRLGNSQRAVASMLRMGRPTLRRYFAALDAAHLLEGHAEQLPDEATLRSAVDEGVDRKPPPQTTSSVERWADIIEKKRAAGAGPTAIHDYLRLHVDGYDASVSSVKRFCRRLDRRRGPRPTDVAVPVVTEPGEVAQVDFLYGGKRLDPSQGVLRRTWIFVMTLGHSRRTYAEFVFDQKVETWLRVHVNAFEYFGGVPKVVVPDNLKAAVIRGAFCGSDEVVLNRNYRELARAYGFQIDPTPIRSPEKKGKVERDAKYIGRNFLPTLADVDVHESQRLLLLWLVEVADKRVHGTTRRAPIEMFESEERDALRALPESRWRPVLWKEVTVHRDSHVQIDGALYSAPWTYMHQKIWARCTSRELRLIADDRLLYSHPRGLAGHRYTVEGHLPEGRRDLRHRSRSYWEAKAEAIGTDVSDLVTAIFDGDDVLLQLRRVQQIVTLLEQYPARRACRAAKRALFYETLEYRAIKNILLKGLDLRPLDDEQPPRRWSRGSQYSRVPEPTLFPNPPSHGTQ